MPDFSISKSLIDEGKIDSLDLKHRLKEMGFSDSEIGLLESRKNLKYKYITHQEYLEILKELLQEMPAFRKSIYDFLRRLDVKVEEKMRSKYSEFNQLGREYIFRVMMEMSGDYELSKRLVELYRKSRVKISPYEIIEVAKRLYRSGDTQRVFFDRLFRAVAELSFQRDERARKEILFKYQTPPYVIDQIDFDVGVGILKGAIRIDDEERYKKIREMVVGYIDKKQGEEAYKAMINDVYVESFSSIAGIAEKTSMIDLITSILYVASGGKYTNFKYIQ